MIDDQNLFVFNQPVMTTFEKLPQVKKTTLQLVPSLTIHTSKKLEADSDRFT